MTTAGSDEMLAISIVRALHKTGTSPVVAVKVMALLPAVVIAKSPISSWLESIYMVRL